MFLLIIIIYKREFLEAFLSSLVEVGILNSIVISTSSLEEELAENVPLFASLKFHLTTHSETKLVLSLIEKEDILIELNSSLMESGIDIGKEKIGEILTIPINNAIGRNVPLKLKKKSSQKKNK